MRFTGKRQIISVALLTTAVLTTSLAYGDAYTPYAVARSSGGVNNIGLTDSGSLTVRTYSGSTADFLYTTFTPPSTSVTSTTAPQLTYDNGSSCTPMLAGYINVEEGTCNSGRTVFTALHGTSLRRNLYLSQTGLPVQLVYAGDAGNILLNDFGDIAFVGLLPADADTNFLYFDTTTHIAPEPASWLLLMTGVGVVGLFRRRIGLA